MSPVTTRVPSSQPGNPELRSCLAAVPGGREVFGHLCSTLLIQSQLSLSILLASQILPDIPFKTQSTRLPPGPGSREKHFHKHTPQNKIPAQSTALPDPDPSQTHPHARGTRVLLEVVQALLLRAWPQPQGHHVSSTCFPPAQQGRASCPSSIHLPGLTPDPPPPPVH